MRIQYTIALSLLAGSFLGVAAVETLQAQAKPPAYVIGEIDITNPEGFAKEFSPVARKALAEGAGYQALVLGGKAVSIEGTPPKSRIIVNRFDSLEDAVKAYSSPDFKEARKIGDKYATFRIIAVQGL